MLADDISVAMQHTLLMLIKSAAILLLSLWWRNVTNLYYRVLKKAKWYDQCSRKELYLILDHLFKLLNQICGQNIGWNYCSYVGSTLVTNAVLQTLGENIKHSMCKGKQCDNTEFVGLHIEIKRRPQLSPKPARIRPKSAWYLFQLRRLHRS